MCSTFRVKKSSTSSVQFLPRLFVNKDIVPTVQKGKSFKYLGRYFNFSMDNNEHMSDLLETVNSLMSSIDKLSCHPKNKILLYHRYVLSKISLNLTIANLSKTRVTENRDNYVRHWLLLPISAPISSLVIPKSKFGINLILRCTKFLQCQTVICTRLSPNQEIQSLWKDQSTCTNMKYDAYRKTK